MSRALAAIQRQGYGAERKRLCNDKAVRQHLLTMLPKLDDAGVWAWGASIRARGPRCGEETRRVFEELLTRPIAASRKASAAGAYMRYKNPDLRLLTAIALDPHYKRGVRAQAIRLVLGASITIPKELAALAGQGLLPFDAEMKLLPERGKQRVTAVQALVLGSGSCLDVVNNLDRFKKEARKFKGDVAKLVKWMQAMKQFNTIAMNHAGVDIFAYNRAVQGTALQLKFMLKRPGAYARTGSIKRNLARTKLLSARVEKNLAPVRPKLLKLGKRIAKLRDGITQANVHERRRKCGNVRVFPAALVSLRYRPPSKRKKGLKPSKVILGKGTSTNIGRLGGSSK